MIRCARFAPLSLLAFAFAVSLAGCHSTPDQSAANSTPATDQSQDQAADPASANLAPIGNATTPSEPAAAPSSQAPAAQSSAATADDSYGEQPAQTAPQPPPPLPEYQQPPAPADDHIWTPGYWAYAPQGYYWVPGVWVAAPYQGALWTPGYWGFVHGRYGFFRGYWGPHIGYYGGVNYGFGYVGVGYQGGYWNGGHFDYNRAVNNINTNVVHSVYSRTVMNPTTVTRVSYNGPGGLTVRARPSEIVALREPHAPPMHAQLEHEQSARADRTSFVSVNHGRPEHLVLEKPLPADRGVKPVMPPEAHGRPAEQRGPAEMHPEHPAPHAEGRPAPHPAAHPEAHPAHPKPSPEQKKKAPEKRPEDRKRTDEPH